MSNLFITYDACNIYYKKPIVPNSSIVFSDVPFQSWENLSILEYGTNRLAARLSGNNPKNPLQLIDRQITKPSWLSRRFTTPYEHCQKYETRWLHLTPLTGVDAEHNIKHDKDYGRNLALYYLRQLKGRIYWIDGKIHFKIQRVLALLIRLADATVSKKDTTKAHNISAAIKTALTNLKTGNAQAFLALNNIQIEIKENGKKNAAASADYANFLIGLRNAIKEINEIDKKIKEVDTARDKTKWTVENNPFKVNNNFAAKYSYDQVIDKFINAQGQPQPTNLLKTIEDGFMKILDKLTASPTILISQLEENNRGQVWDFLREKDYIFQVFVNGNFQLAQIDGDKLLPHGISKAAMKKNLTEFLKNTITVSDKKLNNRQKTALFNLLVAVFNKGKKRTGIATLKDQTIFGRACRSELPLFTYYNLYGHGLKQTCKVSNDTNNDVDDLQPAKTGKKRKPPKPPVPPIDDDDEEGESPIAPGAIK